MGRSKGSLDYGCLQLSDFSPWIAVSTRTHPFGAKVSFKEGSSRFKEALRGLWAAFFRYRESMPNRLHGALNC
ncbi:MAG TPA: hypothetical protein PLK63_16970 [Catalimonadaceae bacterium]|nr:hypothetical protein [Catalimonadaceae bacterium]